MKIQCPTDQNSTSVVCNINNVCIRHSDLYRAVDFSPVSSVTISIVEQIKRENEICYTFFWHCMQWAFFKRDWFGGWPNPVCCRDQPGIVFWEYDCSHCWHKAAQSVTYHHLMALAPVLQVFLKNKTCFNISPLPSHFCGVHFSEHILPNAHFVPLLCAVFICRTLSAKYINVLTL